MSQPNHSVQGRVGPIGVGQRDNRIRSRSEPELKEKMYETGVSKKVEKVEEAGEGKRKAPRPGSGGEGGGVARGPLFRLLLDAPSMPSLKIRMT